MKPEIPAIYVANNFRLKECLPDCGRIMTVPKLTPTLLANIQRTIAPVQRARDHFCCPFKLNSLWRPKEWNARWGSSDRSYHIDALAADFEPCGGKISNLHVAQFVAKMYDVDLTILEFYRPTHELALGVVEGLNSGWTHAQVARDGETPRGERLLAVGTDTEGYPEGVAEAAAAWRTKKGRPDGTIYVPADEEFAPIMPS